MSDANQRIADLFSAIGLDVANGTFSGAEAAAYGEGVQILLDEISAAKQKIFSSSRSEYKQPEDYTADNFSAAAADVCSKYEISGGEVVFTNADADKLSSFWQKWGSPFSLAKATGSGLTWQQIDDLSKTWNNIAKQALWWSYLDTMEVQ